MGIGVYGRKPNAELINLKPTRGENNRIKRFDNSLVIGVLALFFARHRSLRLEQREIHNHKRHAMDRAHSIINYAILGVTVSYYQDIGS